MVLPCGFPTEHADITLTSGKKKNKTKQTITKSLIIMIVKILHINAGQGASRGDHSWDEFISSQSKKA